MNNIRLRGTSADRPSPIDDGTGIHFSLKARHPSSTPVHPLGITHVLSRALNGFRDQNKIRLGRKNRSVRDEAAGRLEQMVAKGGGRPKYARNNRRKHRTLEMIVNQRRLPPRRAR